MQNRFRLTMKMLQWSPLSGALLPLCIFTQLLISTRCSHLRDTKDRNSERYFNYDYAFHGADWKNGQCQSRNRQSPIDLPPTAPITGLFQFKYKTLEESFEVMNTGSTLAIDLACMGYGGVTYDNAYYALMNINVHSGSEHTWNGARQPLELHLVHKRYDSEALLIVAIPMVGGAPPPGLLQLNASHESCTGGKGPCTAESKFTEPAAHEPGFNPTLQMFLKNEPPQINMKVRTAPNPAFNLNSFLQGATFYEYSGSLTAPPCAEIVTWLVRKDSLQASFRQVSYLQDVISRITATHGNYRSVMPLSGRVVGLRHAMPDGPAQFPPPVDLGPKESSRAIRTMKWAKDAMHMAAAATEYINGIDQHLRAAARSHADALSKRLRPPGLREQLTGTAQSPPNLRVAARMMGPIPMEETAQTMARTLAVRDPEDGVVGESDEAAKQAAIQAARLAGTVADIYPR
jgi:carbonic anhydrase